MNRSGFQLAAAAAALAAAGFAGCASQSEKASAQALRDFVEVRGLEEVESMRTGTNDSYREIDDDERFILYAGRRDTYLVEFTRRCYELSDNTRITPDRRWDSNLIRARFDTIRGCRIAKIYALSEADLAELETMGDAPGETL